MPPPAATQPESARAAASTPNRAMRILFPISSPAPGGPPPREALWRICAAPRRRRSAPQPFFLSDSGFQLAPDFADSDAAGSPFAFLSAFGLRFSLLLLT